MRAYNLFVSGPKFTNFFCSMGDELPLIMPFTPCQYLYEFQRYSWSKSKVVLNRTKLGSQILRRRRTTKVVHGLSLPFSGTSNGKVSIGYSCYSQSYKHAFSEFHANFKPPLKKIVRATPVPGGGCASKTWSFSSTCKNLGAQCPVEAEIWSPQKVDLAGYDYTSRSP